MRRKRIEGFVVVVIGIILSSSDPCKGTDPLTAGAVFGTVATSGLLYGFWDSIGCRFGECCNEPYLIRDWVGFKREIKNSLFGQPFVKSVIVPSLKAHLRNGSSKKALTLSLHGLTGTGKNLVAGFVARALYKEGLNSRFVHLFITTLHFPFHDKVDQYKLDLQNWIRGNISACDRSLFIFDEIDKLPAGLMDAIKPFIDHYPSIDGQNYRNAVFMFLSNAGGKQITEKMYETYQSGSLREDVTFFSLESILSAGAFNEQGGLQKSTLIERDLVDHYVPFLPLERKHVKMCVAKELSDRNKTLTAMQIDEIADAVNYWPNAERLFATTGCKRIGKNVDIYLETLKEDDEDEAREEL